MYLFNANQLAHMVFNSKKQKQNTVTNSNIGSMQDSYLKWYKELFCELLKR